MPTPTPTPRPSPSPTLTPTPTPIPPPLAVKEETVAPAVANPDAAQPVRAIPVELDKLTTERVAAYQVALERLHFSCGFVDGDQGMRTRRMLKSYQKSRGLPVTGELDPATRDSIGEPGEPFHDYTVTAEDMAKVVPPPKTWVEKSKAAYLGYTSAWEMLAEKFHCRVSYLKALNPNERVITEGSVIVAPKISPTAPLPKAASLRVLLGDTAIQALDAKGNIIAHFPCSIAKDKNKRPSGTLTVINYAPNPNYTFDPKVLTEAALAENITRKMIIPPGPRNPVGTAWIGLSLPGYGMHGTPEPENISRTQSHGCFRLANWNAEKLLKMIKIGTPVEVVP
jgi:lipoprotein-anchoring transpeptidase ErfK/SrfK